MVTYISRLVLAVTTLCLVLVTVARLLGAALPKSPQLAYVVYGGYTSDIYAVDLVRGVTVQLVTDASDSLISFAPNGDLVFTRPVDVEYSAIFLLDSAGNETRLSPGNVRDVFPVWSPDGTQIAFFSEDAQNDVFTVHVMNRSGGERRSLLLQTVLYNNYPIWLPNSIHIMYSPIGTGQSHTLLINSLNGEIINFTEHTTIRGLPVWSPEGRQIAYVRYSSTSSSIYISEVDSSWNIMAGTTRELTRNQAFNNHPRWSPDGSRLAFVMDNASYPEIYSMDANGRNVVNLSRNPQSGDSLPVWSQDGTLIAFLSMRDGTPQVYVMNADGTALRQITWYRGVAQLSSLAWMP